MPHTLRGIGWLLFFLIIQVSITAILKIAAGFPSWRVGGTVLAATLPILSTFLLMRVFAYLPSPPAQGLGAIAVGSGYVIGV